MDEAVAPVIILPMRRLRRDRFGHTVAAALFALAAMLLSFAHQAPAASSGPVVLAPDGTVAVLCLAEPGDGGRPAVAAHCLACTLVTAAAPPAMPPAMPYPPPRDAHVAPVAAPAAPPWLGWRPAQPRAPPPLVV